MKKSWRLAKNTACSVAYEMCGSSSRWREVLTYVVELARSVGNVGNVGNGSPGVARVRVPPHCRSPIAACGEACGPRSPGRRRLPRSLYLMGPCVRETLCGGELGP